MTMTRKEAIRNYVEQLSWGDLADLIQYMTAYDGCFEEATYYDMDEFDEFMSNYTPSEIARMIWFGEFNPNDEYFRFDAYGNLESLDWQEISDEAGDYMEDVINHLTTEYSGDTPWADLDYIVDSNDDTIFNEDYEEVDREEDQ